MSYAASGYWASGYAAQEASGIPWQSATPVNAISIGTVTRSAALQTVDLSLLSTAPAANRAKVPRNGQTRGYLARFFKQPAEFIDFDVDATAYLRAMNDTLTACNVVASPGVDLRVAMVIGQSVKFWVSGGVDKARSKVTVQLFTFGSRVKEVEILIVIKET